METKLRKDFPIMSQSVIPQQPAPLVDKVSDNEIYYGYANLGVKETEEKWLLVRVTTVGTVTKTEYPNSDMSASYAWSERANYTYSR